MTAHETTERQIRAAWLEQMLAQEGVSFSRDDGWEQVADHVKVHQYFLGRELGFPVSWEDAVLSWYENVYAGLRRGTDSWIVRRAFPGQLTGDLLLAVSDHWHYLKQSDDNVQPEDAARSFVEHYGSGLARLFSGFISA
jgi:hypothetical protein